jgi:hypothetical protein
MELYEDAEIWHHAFLTLTLNGNGQFMSWLLYPKKIASNRRLGGLQGQLEDTLCRKISAHVRDLS